MQTKRIKRPILISTVTFLIMATITGTTALLVRERAAYPPATALLIAVGLSAAIAVLATGFGLYLLSEQHRWARRAWWVTCLFSGAVMFGLFLWLQFFASLTDISFWPHLELGLTLVKVAVISLWGLMTYMAIRGWVEFYRWP